MYQQGLVQMLYHLPRIGDQPKHFCSNFQNKSTGQWIEFVEVINFQLEERSRLEVKISVFHDHLPTEIDNCNEVTVNDELNQNFTKVK